MTNQSNCETLPDAIKTALNRRLERIVIFSGAGMSADSGIPTFRSGENGLWSEFNPSELATPDAWRRDKATVWGWYEWRRGIIMRAQPNPGHIAVAQLQHVLKASVITQNVDDLHERAGVSDVLHLHGRLLATRCDTCGQSIALDPPLLGSQRAVQPPSCTVCSGHARPGVVWFGESLDTRLFGLSERLVEACDLLLVVGTSGVVYPAAGLVALAPRSAIVIEINPEVTSVAGRIDHHLRATAANGLPAIVEHLLLKAN